MSVRLDSYKFGFTTSGGSVFIVPNPKCFSKLSSFITTESDKFEEPIHVTFSWPQQAYHVKDYDSRIRLNVEFNEPSKKITKDNLIPNWKTSMGIITDYRQQAKNFKTSNLTCYPTRSFNRNYEGNDKPEDFFGLGDDFSYYAGHSLTDNLYRINSSVANICSRVLN